MNKQKAEELIAYHREQIEVLKDEINFHLNQIENLQFQMQAK